MILYLDTSALVKLYVDEPGRAVVMLAVERARLWATHLIAYTELRAALARMKRMRRIEAGDLKMIVDAFEGDWEGMHILTPTETHVRRAGELAERYELHGYDSVHLAAAEALSQMAPMEVRFACFDQQLARAASQLGLSLLRQEPQPG